MWSIANAYVTLNFHTLNEQWVIEGIQISEFSAKSSYDGNVLVKFSNGKLLENLSAPLSDFQK